jgi:hypothetical protein
MEVSDLTDVLNEILQRLRIVELKIDVITQGHATMDQLAEIRRDRLAEYKRSYYRQNAVTEPSPCSEDCNGFDELDCATTNDHNEWQNRFDPHQSAAPIKNKKCSV